MIFDFVKKAGETFAGNVGLDKLFGSEPDKAKEEATKQVKKHNLKVEGLDTHIDGDRVILKGKAASAEEAEKAILAIGNMQGVAQVESQLEVQDQSDEPQAQFYKVQSGDTLSAIAKKFYGDANQYNKIFEANKPMLSAPDKIYPDQTLRIPQTDQAAQVQTA